MAEKILGITIAPEAVKVLELEKEGEAYKVLNTGVETIPLSSNLREAQVKALNAVLNKNKIAARSCVLVPWGIEEITYQLVEMPPLPAKEVPQALKYKLESTLPFPIEETIFNYYRAEKLSSTEKVFYFVTAGKKKYIEDLEQTAKKCGLTVKAILPSWNALINAFQITELGASTLIYLGNYFSLIVLVKDGEAVFAREVKIGGDYITRSMLGEVVTETGKIELNFEKAEELKIKFGVPLDAAQYTKEAQIGGEEILSMIRPALERINQEILNTIDYYRKQSGDQTAFSKLYFTGGASLTKNLLEYLGREIEIPMMPFPGSTPSDLTLCLGAALSGKKNLNLQQNEDSLDLKKWQKMLILVSFGLFAVFALAWFGLSYQDKKLNAELKLLKPKLEVLLKQKETTKSEQIVNRLISDYGEQERLDRFVKIISQLELKTITPLDIYLKNLTYNNKINQLMIKGIILKSSGKSGISAFISNLDATGYFAKIDLVSLKESNAYTVPTLDFELESILSGEEKK